MRKRGKPSSLSKKISYDDLQEAEAELEAKAMAVSTAALIKKKPRLTFTQTKSPPPPATADSHVSSSSHNKTSVKEEQVAIPLVIYELVQEALTLMKHLQTHPNDNDSKYELDTVRSIIKASTEYHKSINELQNDWIFDPATAHTLVPLQPTSSPVIINSRCSSRKAHGCCPPPLLDDDREFHADDITLTGNDMDIWIDFKTFVKDVPQLSNISLNDLQQLKTLLNHPIVDVLGRFAVSAFNKACHMHFKKDVLENLQDFQIMKCKYLKLVERFLFYLTIEAFEEGVPHVYKIKIMSDCEDRITLLRFVLTDRTPAGKRPEKQYITSNPDDWCDPEDDFYSGLVARDELDPSLGFDYFSPFGAFGP